MKRFQDLQIVELRGSAAGGYAAKLFSTFGARVVVVGDQEQRSPAAERALHLFLDAGKEQRPDLGADGLESLLERSDVVIESSSPGPLEPGPLERRTLELDLPQLVRVLISPFGPVGPYSRYRSNGFTDDAVGGHVFLNGDPARPPLARPGHHALFQAGAHGFIGAMAALWARERLGRGQVVEISHHEGLVAMHQYTTVMWSQAGHALHRVGNRQGGHFHPVGVYRCKGGYVSLAMPSAEMLAPFLEAAGLSSLLDDPRFADDHALGQHKDEFDAAIAPWLMAHTAAEIIELGQSVRAPVGPVWDLLEVLEDPQLVARKVFAEQPAGGAETVRMPAAPFRIEGRVPREDREGPRDPDRDDQRTGPAVAGDPGALSEGPLQGLRVLDLTRVWAGPLATRMLGDLGADVVKIEATWGRGPADVPAASGRLTHLYPEDEVGADPWNRNASFNKLNRNKRSVTLELSRPEGRRLLESLVESADLVVENFSPRVMAKLGLGLERLREINPEIIYVQMPGFGSSGPYRDWLAFGPMIESTSGLTHRMGYPDSGPYRSGVAWPDPVTALHAAAAVMIALWERESSELSESRPSLHVEVPMIEAMVFANGDQIVEAQLRGESPPRLGSRCSGRVQGCYPCAAPESWLALSVGSEAEWRAAARVLDDSGALARMPLSAAIARHDEVDVRLGELTARWDVDELVRALQNAGVTAQPAVTPQQLYDDPQLRARSFWAELDHPSVGRREYPGLPIRLSATPATYRRAAPCLGEHNHEVLGGELGLTAAELETLERELIVARRPPPGATSRGLSRDRLGTGTPADNGRSS